MILINKRGKETPAYMINEIPYINQSKAELYKFRNYRFRKNEGKKIGRRIGKELYFTLDEIKIYMQYNERRKLKELKRLYNVIKRNPGVKEEELPFIFGKSKENTINMLTDISLPPYCYNYKGLYEEDDGGLFVKGFETKNKKEV